MAAARYVWNNVIFADSLLTFQRLLKHFLFQQPYLTLLPVTQSVILAVAVPLKPL